MNNKMPFIIYLAAIAFLLDIVMAAHTPTLHPDGKASIITKLIFWFINVGSFVIGIFCWKNQQKITGAVGVVIALTLSVLFFAL